MLNLTENEQKLTSTTESLLSMWSLKSSLNTGLLKLPRLGPASPGLDTESDLASLKSLYTSALILLMVW